jgi:hypothetical protein
MREAASKRTAPTRATGLSGLTLATASIRADMRTAFADGVVRRKR